MDRAQADEVLVRNQVFELKAEMRVFVPDHGAEDFYAVDDQHCVVADRRRVAADRYAGPGQ